MKLAIALCASLMLASTSSFADPVQGPLPPGKPAGTHTAQGLDDTTLYVLAGLAVLGIIIGVAASTGGSSSASGTAPPMVTPH